MFYLMFVFFCRQQDDDDEEMLVPSTEHVDPIPQPLEGPLPMEGFVLFDFLSFCFGFIQFLLL